MPLYLLKNFDPSGRLTRRFEFRSSGDDEAMTAMFYLNENRLSELWCGARLVNVWRGALTGVTVVEEAADRQRPSKADGRPKRAAAEKQPAKPPAKRGRPRRVPVGADEAAGA